MALSGPRLTTSLVVAAAVVAALAYLRDPPWLLNLTSGLSPWETDAEGIRYRWTRGRASFFVPADAGEIALRLRSIKDTPADWPITATIAIDGRPADRIRIDDEQWQTVRFRLPPRGTRAVRRIDISLDRLRAGQRGLQLALVLPLPHDGGRDGKNLAEHR